MIQYGKYFFLLSTLFITSVISAQHENKEDSMKKLIAMAKSDTERIRQYFELTKIGSNSNDSEKEYATRGLELEKKLGKEVYTVSFLQTIGNTYCNESNYSKALEFYLEELKTMEDAKWEERKIITVYHAIGNVYAAQNNFDKALEFYNKVLNIALSTTPKNKGMAVYTYNDVGSVLNAKGSYKEALDVLQKSLKMVGEAGPTEDRYIEGMIYNNMGDSYDSLNKLDSALDYYVKGLEKFKWIGMNEKIASSAICIGNLYLKRKENDKAIIFFNEVIDNAAKAQAYGVLIDIYNGLARAYAGKGDYKEAYQFHERYSSLKDSVLNLDSRKQLNEMETKFESAAKDKELIKKDAESKRQKILTYFVLAIALAIGVIAILIFRSLKTSNRQKAVIEKQKVLVEEKNNDILASIRYAQRIQNALLASDLLLKKYLPEYFILFKPKDIVSGDFYWATSLEASGGNKFVLCTGDCTGHGVPGAFMSLLNISLLNEAAIERKHIHPNLILDYVRARVTNALNQEGKEESKDGMDCSLCVFDFANKKLEAACANNPVWIAKNNSDKYTIEEIKPDKMPVGIHGGVEKPFGLNEISLNKGDIIYTFTDGFADQFGGPAGKKFKYQQLKELLLANAGKVLNDQRKILEEKFDEWKGKLDQTDDILIIGVRI